MSNDADFEAAFAQAVDSEPAAPEAAPVTPEDVLLLREIRDSLKNR